MLCHDGYLPEHIFVDDAWRFCGVTDFGDYEGNLPVHDFAVMPMSGGASRKGGAAIPVSIFSATDLSRVCTSGC